MILRANTDTCLIALQMLASKITAIHSHNWIPLQSPTLPSLYASCHYSSFVPLYSIHSPKVLRVCVRKHLLSVEASVFVTRQMP